MLLEVFLLKLLSLTIRLDDLTLMKVIQYIYLSITIRSNRDESKLKIESSAAGIQEKPPAIQIKSSLTHSNNLNSNHGNR